MHVWLAQHPDCKRTVVAISTAEGAQLIGPKDAAFLGQELLAAAGQANERSRSYGYTAPEQRCGLLARFFGAMWSDRFPIVPDPRA